MQRKRVNDIEEEEEESHHIASSIVTGCLAWRADQLAVTVSQFEEWSLAYDNNIEDEATTTR